MCHNENALDGDMNDITDQIKESNRANQTFEVHNTHICEFGE